MKRRLQCLNFKDNKICRKKYFQQKRIHLINKKKVFKTAIYNFYDSQTSFDRNSEQQIEFICIVCHKIKKEKIGESSNLASHLKDHNLTTDGRLAWWFTALEKQKK
jgi:hypothetical protein